MYLGKTKNSITGQRGFFTIGVSLTLLGIYSTIAAGIFATHEPGASQDEQLVSHVQLEVASNANDNSVNR